MFLALGIWISTALQACSAETLSTSLSPSLPDAAPSLVRVLGALALVIGLFLGGVWLFRNWQRLGVRRGSGPKLNVLEARSLGGRQSIYVIAYEQERFLLSATPAGIHLLSHLPASAEVAERVEPASPTEAGITAIPIAFDQALAQILHRK
jgi:flagellar biogenesis protein FliO